MVSTASYIPFTNYRYAWFYRHRDLPVATEDLARIHPLTPQAAESVWRRFISASGADKDSFTQQDWPVRRANWAEEGNWQVRWEENTAELPEEILEHLLWSPDTLIYFCYGPDHVIETSWEVFQRCWKNCLFLDDGPILLGRRQRQAVQFFQTGNFRLGTRT